MRNRLSIIDTLESARKTQGLTQEELALKAGTSRVTVGRVESGFDPKLATVHELARALGLELLLVPKVLAGEVQAFIQSGGRVLAQPSGVGAPDSVVTQALAISQATHRLTQETSNELENVHSARSLARQLSARNAGVRPPQPAAVWSARSVAQQDLTSHFVERMDLPVDAFSLPAAQEVNKGKGPGISAAALARLQVLSPPKGGKK